jgi:dihydropteroate synthase
LKIGSLLIGEKYAPKVMGIINVSPESFYKGSVKTDKEEIASTAKLMQQAGAHIIDIGAMSTAPYLDTIIDVREEVKRMKRAIKTVKSACDLPVSADTPRACVAEEAIAAGADAINDVTGLKYDDRMSDIVAKAGVPVIAGAYRKTLSTGKLAGTINALEESITIAKKTKIADVIIDPSIGFFREEGKNPFYTRMTDMPWYTRDIEVIYNLGKLAVLRPVCVSVSRKSFIGHLFNNEAKDRLIPSIICEAIAVLNGASIVRTHSVRETAQALTMLQLLKP